MGLRLIQYRGKKTTKNKTAHKGAPNSVALLNSQAPCFGPKIREIWIFFPPYIHIYKPECSMFYKLGFKKEL